MKQLIVSVMILSFAIGGLIAQTKDSEEKEMRRIEIQMDGDLADLQETQKMLVKLEKDLQGGNNAPDAPFMGIFVEDLSFPKAQELGYKGYVGVLVTGVVPDSPAWTYRLQEDDIIVSIDAKEVTNNAAFDKMRKLYRAGDMVVMELFRSGEIITLDFTFGSRQTKAPIGEDGKSEKKKLSPGYGGGSWLPMWFTCDLEDVNYLLSSMGFTKLNEDGIFMQGGGGKGNVGKGFFIGGVGYGYTTDDKIPSPTDGTYHVWMKYSNTMAGVTLDKRIPFTKNFVGSLGVMLGGGSHTLEVMKNNSDYDWSAWSTTFLNSQNTHSTISRSYLVAQPKAELMFRLLSWLSIRGEAAYVYGYAPSSGWKVNGMSGETIDVKNSPNTEYQGLSFSVGPWFGF